MIRKLAAFLLLALLCPGPARAELPAVGDVLPGFAMQPPPLAEDVAALGIADSAPFTLADVGTPYVLLEIIGVYCAVCHEQAPDLVRLWKRLKKTRLDKRITVLGIAAGATPMEVEFVRSGEYPFPVVPDTRFEIYASLNEPKTPFTLIVDRQGRVLYAHQGIVPDFKAFFSTIQELVQ